MRRFKLYIARSGAYGVEISDKDISFLKLVKETLLKIFGSKCSVTVGYVKECIDDGRYNDIFSKLED
ncbi:unnamed protein product [Ambrosiozyma monospora]|uniref:Unnamed protein product n=1 Tax=Ambrosiozyma monospora TaxID=43982 RepID=A0ACB5U9R7_AMBMO|nr:unnamed protein product [Ambrosiozyma monospora]